MHEVDLPMPDEIEFRRSLRASQARRSAAATRRRRTVRTRSTAVLAAAGLVLGAGGAVAHQTGGTAAKSSSVPAASGPGTVAAAQTALGIAADGIVGPQTRRAVRAFERRNGFRVDGRLDSRVLRALGVSARRSPARRAAVRASAPDVLEAIALCESGGDPTAVSANGRYRGKYQFSRATWRAMGGKGDPAAAPEAEQDRRAAALLAQSGTRPWPACSRKIGAR